MFEIRTWISEGCEETVSSRIAQFAKNNSFQSTWHKSFSQQSVSKDEGIVARYRPFGDKVGEFFCGITHGLWVDTVEAFPVYKVIFAVVRSFNANMRPVNTSNNAWKSRYLEKSQFCFTTSDFTINLQKEPRQAYQRKALIQTVKCWNCQWHQVKKY